MMQRVRRILASLLGAGRGDDSLEGYYLRVLRHDGVAPTKDQAQDDFERSAVGVLGWQSISAHVEARRDAVRPYRR
ncbi:MAG: hypothetical protein HY677_07490 [Chloroflexi bacterium]|nr:hypothetical protein [Chloroflexota bacterium]